MARKKAASLRIGMISCSTGTFTASIELGAAFSGTAESSFQANIQRSVPMTLSVVSDSHTFSTLFGSLNVFSGFSEVFWGTDFTTATHADQPLIFNYHHSQTPVRYQRLDDIRLTYSGETLTTVTRESGDTVQLSYDVDGNLIKVTDLYTNTIKDLSYTGDDLTGIVISKSV